jgi:hypothetical protein
MATRRKTTLRRPMASAGVPTVIVAGLAVAAALGGPLPAAVAAGSLPAAGSIAVTTTVDGGPGSLRAAVIAAGASGTATAVDVPAGAYTLSRCGADDTGAAGDLDLRTTAAVTIAASAGSVTIRQTCPGERVLQALGGGRLTLTGLTVAGGSVIGTAGAGAAGGGIWAQGDVVLDRTTVTGNSARGGDGATAATVTATPGAGGSARGGGLWVGGRLIGNDAILSSNTATAGAGGATAGGSSLTGGAGGAASGGGAYVVGTVALNAGSLTGDVAVGGAGGAADGGRTAADGTATAAPGGAGGSARGGGIAQQAQQSSTPVALVGVATSGNRVTGGAAGLYRTELPSLLDIAYPPAGAAAGGAVSATGTIAASDVHSSDDRAVGGSSTPQSCSFACGAGPASGAAHGGALQTASSAAVVGSIFKADTATSGEAFYGALGRVPTEFGFPAGLADGGAIDAVTNLALSATSISGSSARNGLGFPRVTSAAAGGAAHAGGRLTVSGGSFTQDVAGRALVDSHGGVGGALAAADLRLTGVTLTSNTAAAAGGAAWSSGPLRATQTTFTGNNGGGSGGAAHADGDLTAVAVTATANAVAGDATSTNREGSGGGLDAGGAMRLTRTAVTGNNASVTFLFPQVGREPAVAFGGGVRAGSLVAADSTISGNTVFGLELTAITGDRGHEITGGGVFVATSARLTNTTVSDNTLTRGALDLSIPSTRAGGVSAASLSLVNATLTGNVVNEAGPSLPNGQLAAAGGTVQAGQLTAVGAVIVPNAGQRACVSGVAAAGTSAYDVLGDSTCGLTGTGVATSAAGARLGPVAANGGPVPTQLPGAGSTLIDALPTAACQPPTDARGITRPQGPACDIGAVEVTKT